MAYAIPGKHFRQNISPRKIFPDSITAEKWFVEQRWGNTSTYPHCGSENIQYVEKFAGRHNILGQNTLEQMVGISKGMGRKQLKHEDLSTCCD